MRKKLSARPAGRRSTKTGQPDLKSYDKPTVGVYRRIRENPDIAIYPGFSEQEKIEAWEQINQRCHPMAEFIIMVRKTIGVPVSVNVWFGDKK